MTRFSSVLIGGESLLIRCAETLLARGHPVTAIVSTNPEIVAWASEKGIQIRDKSSLSDLTFDWLMSIANLNLIPDDILALPSQGAINFHDGPLPRYAGLNAPVWAILNGEATHAVTWHMIEGGVDEGDILQSQTFEIAADETAFTLNAKCYAAAVESFASLVSDLETGEPRRVPQDLAQRSYYGRDKRPDAAGVIDPFQTPARICSLVRALDHGTYLNPLCRAKIVLSGKVILIGGSEPCRGDGAPGTILEADAKTLRIVVRDGAVRLTGLALPDGAPVDIAGLAAPGETLDVIGEKRRAELTAMAQSAASGEPFWRRMLAVARPIQLPLFGNTSGQGVLARALRLPDGLDVNRVASIAAATAIRSTGETEGSVAFRDGPSPAKGMMSEWGPLHFAGEAFETAAAAFEASLSEARRRPTFATDLVARDPNISAPAMPDFGISFSAEAIPDCPLTLCLTKKGAVLKGDAARLSEAAFELTAARIETLAERHAKGKVDSLALDRLPIICAEEEEDVLRVRNETRWKYDPTQLMQAHVERQAVGSPDAIALIFETDALSHSELEKRANQIAHALIAMGVGPGVRVGLFCRRGFDLVAGALGILKAGGAYVPMDPTYPSDRIAHYISDSGASVIVTQAALVAELPDCGVPSLPVDKSPEVARAPDTRPEPTAMAQDLAYLIYTSGSTGTPKGVMVEHRNVANFFVGMDAYVDRRSGDTWMAVTSLSFDIAVLELFYALSRGFRVVIGGDADRMPVAGVAQQISDKPMDFSLFYWGNDDGPGARKYNLLLEGAKFADANGFRAVWTPERHFHAFGGPYPNPAVTGAAVAAVTNNLDVRAGSCVAPLHHPARIAEEWAVIDNLTNGRAGIGFASGWQPDDFVLRPENTPPANKPAMFDTLDKVRRLWRGEEVEFRKADGTDHAVLTQPRPVSSELAVWVTTAGNPDTWREAGKNGANVLTHLLGQSIDEVAGKIRIYRDALQEAGHDPDAFKVTLMLHTFLANDREKAREIAREPMKDYLRSAAGLIKQYAWAFPAFKKPAGTTNPMDIDLGSLSDAELDGILDFAFLRYFEDSGLFGTVDDGIARVESLKSIGVDEIACLIDYGIAPEIVLDGLKPLADVLARTNEPAEDVSLAAQISRYGVTHMQCTPSMARMITLNDAARDALSGMRQLILGGEALPGALVKELSQYTSAQILNMYGPTETTIWSTVADASADENTSNIGRPIANTQVYVLDADGAPAPIGVPGELCIAGDGVTRGYWERADLTAERFVKDPVTGGRMYRTGDLVRWRLDGAMDFLGRIDTQIKLRGYRIELGEIEARLSDVEGVREAVVVPRNVGGDTRLIAYVTGSISERSEWRAELARHLPDFMIPAQLIPVKAFPLTPNRKIDRNALPTPVARPVAVRPSVSATPVSETETRIVQTFARLLGQTDVRADDNFFALGGHSLLAVQAHRDLQEFLGKGKIAITDIFRFPTARGLAVHLDAAAPSAQTIQPQDRAVRTETIQARRAMRRNRVKETG